MSIEEIKKDTSVFANITEAIQIIDKRQVLAIVYPVKEQSVIKKLSGKYKNRVQKSDMSLEEIKEFSIQQFLKQKSKKQNNLFQFGGIIENNEEDMILTNIKTDRLSKDFSVDV